MTGQPYSRDAALRRTEGGGLSAAVRGSATPPISVPSSSISCSTRCATIRAPTTATTKSTRWRRTGRRADGTGLGHKLRPKEGYFPVPPADALQDARTNMVIDPRTHRHPGRGAPPRSRNRRPGRDRHALRPAHAHGRQRDDLQIRGQECRAQARHDRDLHAQAAVWRQRLGHARAPEHLAGRSADFAGDGYAGSSETMRYYIGGLLKHAPALLAICAPTVNSYRRLVPGFEAPVNLGYSQRNRSAACRIPMYSANPKAKRVEFRCPDPSCNPYLAFAAMLMAGLDGIQQPHQSGRSDRQESLRSAAGGARQGSVGTRIARRSPRRARERSRISCSRVTCSPRTWWKPTSATSARASSTKFVCARIHTNSCFITTSDAASIIWPAQLVRDRTTNVGLRREKRTIRNVRALVAIRCKADITVDCQKHL